jgi:ubiquinone/menaquinone biosynthesis C-methylase UbiE
MAIQQRLDAAVVLPMAFFLGLTACRGPEGTAARHGGLPRDAHEPHENLDESIARQESPERAKWQKPDEVVAALKLEPGERVADVGCGPGYFTIPIAKAVGPTGKVWAVDIEPQMLARARQHAVAAGLANIEYVHGVADDPLLPSGVVDTILIVNTFHHFSDCRAYVAKLRKALVPGGRIVNIDFTPKLQEQRGFGPPLEMQLRREVVDQDMAAAGLRPVKVHEFLPEQYFVEYRAR